MKMTGQRTGFLPPEEFEKTADLFFAQPGYVRSGAGSGPSTPKYRIVTGIQASFTHGIDDDAPVLFTGHGGVGTLLMCHLMGAPISRIHDQKRGGSWYRFDKTWLTSQSAPDLAWTEL